ncbi:hypothetical protein [Parapedobacter soli]|uniref:hypothetical protein n=1 Tax=Parapedobacter soli TaxID=416955 RepID=UPI0021C66B9E|nr:hypothetical protein [Parapedobacter soli]
MTEDELLVIEVENFSKYVETRKKDSGLAIERFAEMVNVSKGEISKIINQRKKSVSLHSFCNIAINSGDTIENVRDAVYTHRKLDLINNYEIERRTNFGEFMRSEIEGENTFEHILGKTGIEKQRLIDIYFNTGAPEPYEFLLIEKAVGKEPGEMMKAYVEKYPVKKGND